MQRLVIRGSVVASVFIAAAMLLLAGRFIGIRQDAVASVRAEHGSSERERAPLDEFVAKLPPKSSLGVVQGEKTIAPVVPRLM